MGSSPLPVALLRLEAKMTSSPRLSAKAMAKSKLGLLTMTSGSTTNRLSPMMRLSAAPLQDMM